MDTRIPDLSCQNDRKHMGFLFTHDFWGIAQFVQFFPVVSSGFLPNFTPLRSPSMPQGHGVPVASRLWLHQEIGLPRCFPRRPDFRDLEMKCFTKFEFTPKKRMLHNHFHIGCVDPNCAIPKKAWKMKAKGFLLDSFQTHHDANVFIGGDYSCIFSTCILVKESDALGP